MPTLILSFFLKNPPKEISHMLLKDDAIKPLVEVIENSLLYCDVGLFFFFKFNIKNLIIHLF